MNFRKDKPIYIQIKNLIENKIIENLWNEKEKIPSVRKFAKELGVNPNTVMKSIKELQKEGVLKKIRGVGNKITEGSRKKLLNKRKKRFYKKDINKIIKKAKLLDISRKRVIDELRNRWKE